MDSRPGVCMNCLDYDGMVVCRSAIYGQASLPILKPFISYKIVIFRSFLPPLIEN